MSHPQSVLIAVGVITLLGSLAFVGYQTGVFHSLGHFLNSTIHNNGIANGLKQWQGLLPVETLIPGFIIIVASALFKHQIEKTYQEHQTLKGSIQ